VGYEGDIITAELFANRNHRKFIPVLRSGDWQSGIPTWLSGKSGIDLRGDPYSQDQYQELFAALHGLREEAPPIGPLPKKRSAKQSMPNVPRAKAKKSGPQRASRKAWAMIGEEFIQIDTVRLAEMEIVVTATTSSGEEAAVFARLRAPIHRHNPIPFAIGVDAHLVRVDSIESQTSGTMQEWTLRLTVEKDGFGSNVFEASSFGIGGHLYSADDIARMRACRILLNDPPPTTGRFRGFGSAEILSGYIDGSGRFPTRDCIVRNTHATHGTSSNWRDFARLKSAFLLKASGVVSHILEFTIGPERKGAVQVTFRGERNPRYTGAPPSKIELAGSCPLGN
jgi:hypothetical protein